MQNLILFIKCSSSLIVLLAAGMSTGSGPKHRPIRIQLISSLPTSQEILLGEVSDMDMLPDTNVLVLDGQAQKLYEFSFNTGGLIGAIAREGKGPGEISGAYSYSLEAAPDGSASAVYDLKNAKMVFWDNHGRHLKDYPMPVGWGTSISWNEEGLFFKRQRFRPDNQGIRVVEYSKVNLGNGAREVAGVVSLTQNYETAYSCVFCPWTLSPQNTIVTFKNDTTYAVYEITPDGILKQTWTRQGLPLVRYTKEELEEIEQRREESPIPYPVGASLPVYKNRFKALSLDDAGRLWVQLSTKQGEGSVFDIFERSGAFLQRISTKGNITMLKIRCDYLLARSDNESSEPKALVYRIVG